MTSTLHVLERAHPGSRRLHSQRIEHDEMPAKGFRFICRTGPVVFKTDRVELVQDVAADLFFKTRHTAYLLVREPLDAEVPL